MLSPLLSLAFLGFFPAFNSPPPFGQVVAWQTAKVFDVPTQPDPVLLGLVNDYLNRLESLGYARDRQGIWMQSEWAHLGENQPNRLFSAASLTKVATSLAVLEKWGLDHQFVTRFYSDGPVVNGVLQGNLIVAASYDPLWVWEEAIAVGNYLNQQGIREVTGNLIIVGPWTMNFEKDPLKSGEFLKQAFNGDRWSNLITKAYEEMPAGTPRPQLTINGSVQIQAQIPPTAQPLLDHQSPSTGALIKQMNIYSNNDIAEVLAESVGGARVVMDTALQLAQVPPQEIQLANGSGLGMDNRLSPQAVTRLYQAIETRLRPLGKDLDDLFPVMGRDRQGTLEWRSMPKGLTVKTGTLNQVSALAGIIPTQERGRVWFSIINSGPNFDRLRAEQDRFLQQVANHWQILPTDLEPGPLDDVILGDPARNRPPAPEPSP